MDNFQVNEGRPRGTTLLKTFFRDSDPRGEGVLHYMCVGGNSFLVLTLVYFII